MASLEEEYSTSCLPTSMHKCWRWRNGRRWFGCHCYIHQGKAWKEREGDFSDPSASRESLTRFPYENWISSSILPSFLPLLLCGSEYLCIRGGDRSTGRRKRDRGISLIWGTSGLGASLDTYFSDHTPLLLASFGLHSYLNANIISTPI